MIVPIILLCLLGLASSNYYPPTQSLENYYQRWNGFASRLNKIDFKHLANPQEQCGKQPCPFYVYVEENPHIAIQPNRNKTLLVVAGLRGNDLLGPAAILNLYGKVKAGRIIYFPIANPSAFMRHEIEAYPTGVKVEEDFPLWGRQKCNQSSAVKILDFLFRTYSIDLTIYLHDGVPGVSYSWTSKEFRPNKTLEEEPIYEWIGSFLSQRYYRFSNEHKQTITEFNFNSEKSDVVDWAFGASQYPEILTTICNNRQYEPYTPYMMNGLSVGLAIGELESTSQDHDKFDRLTIDRGVFLAQSLVAIVNPYVQIRAYKNNTFEAKIEGCKNASITTLKLFNKNLGYIAQAKINKTVTNQKSWNKLGTIEFEDNKELLDEGEFNIEFSCDVGWVNRGTTMLSHYRQYYSQHFYTLFQDQTTKAIQIINNPKLPTNQQPTVSIISTQNRPSSSAISQGLEQSGKSYDLFLILKMGGIAVLVLFAVCCIINCWQVGSATLKDRLKTRNEKFEMVEYAETLDDDSGLTPRGDRTLHKEPHSQAQHLS